MREGRLPRRWIRLVLLFVLPGAACGLLPVWFDASPGGAGIIAPGPVAGVLPGFAQRGSAPSATMTPFLPVANTPTPVPPAPVAVVVTEPVGLLTAQELGAQGSLPPAEPMPAPTAPPDPFGWHGLELSGAGGPLRLVISPPDTVNWGSSVEVAFDIGYPCEYADHRACVSAHEDGRLLLATVHSGVGGEGQMLRHALEGTGFNRAGYGLEQIAANVDALRGAPVRAEQAVPAEQVLPAQADLRVLAAGRVPAAAVAEYFSLPFDEALALAGFSLDEEIASARAGESALLVIETCGWRQNEEAWAPGISDTTGSVYLVVIGARQ